MERKDYLGIYNATRAVPSDAKKKITGGRLNGMTDINPMWRIKTLTEQFGPCGFGWQYEITKQWLEQGAAGEVMAFCNINLYVCEDGLWSRPIPGTGGSAFVANEKNGPRTNDECYKMALTDAISVACKALGFGADVYWEGDRTKYDQPRATIQQESKRIMTREEFKARWESNEHGGGITFDDIADCAKAWGICGNPRTHDINKIKDMVLAAAGINEKPIDPAMMPGGSRFLNAVEGHAKGLKAGNKTYREVWAANVGADATLLAAFDEAVENYKVNNNLK